jgi:uncharacterized RDD family membrane protein YckC
MSYWQILDIDETADLKTIKRAYAGKLKVTKPDEDAEGFKRLHAAYKQACKYARNNASVEEVNTLKPVVEAIPNIKTQVSDDPAAGYEEPLPEDSFKLVLDLPEQLPIEHTTQYSTEDDVYKHELEEIARTDVDEEYAFLQQQWQEITAKVDEITANDKTMNDIDSWEFLNGRDALLDLQFKSELSSYIFGRLADRLSETLPKPVFNKAVFIFLDSLFLWSDRSDLLEDEFGHVSVDNVMQTVLAVTERKIEWTSPRVHKGKMSPTHYFTRVWATLLDWLLLGFIAVLLGKLGVPIVSTGNDSQMLNFIGGVLFYIALAPFMEASPLQGTPGKILFGMKVVNNKGRRLHILHALLRSVVFSLVLAAFKVTVWVNIFIKDHRLLHDRFSFSMVIKR